MFGASKEDLIDRYLEDRPLWGGCGEDVDNFRTELDRMVEEGAEASEIRIEDVRARIVDRSET